jgi:hypothetical protein
MAKIFNDFHSQIFVQMFVFNSWPKKQHSLYEKSAGNFLMQKKMLGLGAILFDKAFSTNSMVLTTVMNYDLLLVCLEQHRQQQNCIFITFCQYFRVHTHSSNEWDPNI